MKYCKDKIKFICGLNSTHTSRMCCE